MYYYVTVDCKTTIPMLDILAVCHRNLLAVFYLHDVRMPGIITYIHISYPLTHSHLSDRNHSDGARPIKIFVIPND